MSFKHILLAGVAVAALTGVARANDDTYRCGDSICYDDQADETRRLNEMQLENPGAGVDAVPGDDDSYDTDDDGGADGQGGPYYPVDPSDDSYPPDAPDDNAYPDDRAYPDDDSYPDQGDEPDDADDGYDDDDMPYPNEDDD